MDLSDKCIREGCLYKKNNDINNNNGLYCCRRCMTSNRASSNKNIHGLKCNKKLIAERFIYCNASEGFNDILRQLMCVTAYAIKYRYSIILNSDLYVSCKYGDIFDFKNYPCKIFIDQEAKTLIKDLKEAGFKEHTDTSASVFNLSNIYSPDLILVRRGYGGKSNRPINNSNKTFRFFSYIRLTDIFKRLVLEKLARLPKIYYGIHIRDTDHLAKCNKKTIREYLSSITNEAVVLATDNIDTLNEFCNLYKNIVPTGTLDNILSDTYYSLHYSFSNEPDNLQNAVLDLLIIANATHIKTTFDFGGQSGFSELIRSLYRNKKLLEELL